MPGLHCDLQASLVVCTGLVAMRHVGFPDHGSNLRSLNWKVNFNHWTTKEVPSLHVIWKVLLYSLDCLFLQLKQGYSKSLQLFSSSLLTCPSWHQWCVDIISPLLGKWEPSGTSSSVFHSCSSEERRTCPQAQYWPCMVCPATSLHHVP